MIYARKLHCYPARNSINRTSKCHFALFPILMLKFVHSSKNLAVVNGFCLAENPGGFCKKRNRVGRN